MPLCSLEGRTQNLAATDTLMLIVSAAIGWILLFSPEASAGAAWTASNATGTIKKSDIDLGHPVISVSRRLRYDYREGCERQLTLWSGLDQLRNLSLQIRQIPENHNELPIGIGSN